MKKAFTLCLLIVAAFYSHAQDLAQLNCPSPNPLPPIVVDKEGNMVIPNLIPLIEANNPGLDLNFTQSPEAGLFNYKGLDGGSHEIRVIGWSKDGEAKAYCSQNFFIKDTIPPSLDDIITTGGWRASSFYCAIVLTFDFWSGNVYDNTGVVEVISPKPGHLVMIEKGKSGQIVKLEVQDRYGNYASKEVFVGYPSSYPYQQEISTTWAANTTIGCNESTLPTNTGSTLSTSNTPCEPEVSYSDVSTKGIDPTKPDYYNYTITRKWLVSPFFLEPEVSQDQIIAVQDVTAPVLSVITPSLATLPSGGNKYYDVALNYTSIDGCSPVKNTITVTSNEPGRGNGNKSADWEIINDHLVRLKAENGNGKEDRIYIITVTSEDVSGNKTTKSTTVTVVKPKGKKSEMAGSTLSANLQIVEAGSLQLSSAPNPTTTSFKIRIAGTGSKEKVMLKITNAVGQVIEVRAVAAGQTISLGSSYQSGIYYVEAIQGKEKASLKLVKTK